MDAAMHFCGVGVFSHVDTNHSAPVVLRIRKQSNRLLGVQAYMQLVWLGIWFNAHSQYKREKKKKSSEGLLTVSHQVRFMPITFLCAFLGLLMLSDLIYLLWEGQFCLFQIACVCSSVKYLRAW